MTPTYQPRPLRLGVVVARMSDAGRRIFEKRQTDKIVIATARKKSGLEGIPRYYQEAS